MDCKHVNDHLVDYLYQELDSDQLDRIEGHLKECDGCASELAAFESTRQLMQQLPQLEPPTSVTDRLLQQAALAVQPEEKLGFWERLRAGLRVLVLHPAMTAAVALVLVLGVSFYAYRQSSPPSRALRADLPEVVTAAPAGRTAEVDRVEEQAMDPMEANKDQVAVPVAHKQAEPQPTTVDKSVGEAKRSVARGRLSTTAKPRPARIRRKRRARRPPMAKPRAAPSTRLRKGPSNEALNPYDDVLSGAGASKADDFKSGKKSPKVARQKKTKGASAGLWLARARLASKKGGCDVALRYYHRALELDPQLRRTVGPEVQRCARIVGRRSPGMLAKIQQQLPLLAGWLEAEMAIARRKAAKRKPAKKKASKKAEQKKAAPAQAMPAAD